MFQLLEENSEEFKGLSYEELLEDCSELADQFLKSGFNIPNRSIYDCVSSFIRAKVQEKKKRRKRFYLFLFFRFFLGKIFEKFDDLSRWCRRPLRFFSRKFSKNPKEEKKKKFFSKNFPKKVEERERKILIYVS